MKTIVVHPKWKKNDIIRHKISGHPYLVIHIYKNMGTIVTDMMVNSNPSITFTILPRDYNQYAMDSDMRYNDETLIVSWQYAPQSL